MQIRGLMMDPVTNMPIIVLKDIGSDLILPIWVGIFEANAIALELEKTTTPRPMTHDLLRNLARGLNAQVTKVVVSELRDDTFYALIWMDHAGETVAMDARPSDAIGLASSSQLGLPYLRQPHRARNLQAVHRWPAKHRLRRDAPLARKSQRRRDGPL